MRCFLVFSYDGAAYHGWQVQPNAVTVQQKLEEALSTVMRTSVTVVGAGRTDSGVNAMRMIAHVDLPDDCDLKQLKYKLNRLLPSDIAVYDILPVKHDAHARFDAVSRKYCYYVTTEKSPFARRYACRVPADLDFDAMNSACGYSGNGSDSL